MADMEGALDDDKATAELANREAMQSVYSSMNNPLGDPFERPGARCIIVSSPHSFARSPSGRRE